MLQTYCLSQTSKGIPVHCRIERRENFGGCRVVVERAGQALVSENCHERGEGTNAPPQLVGVTGLVCARGVMGSAQWRTMPLPEDVNWSRLVSSDPEGFARFWTAVGEFCGSKADAVSVGIVRFLSKGTIR